MAIPTPTPKLNIEISGLEEHLIEFTQDEDELSKIMWILIDGMYDDPTRALFREYLSNCMDSHVRAGQTRPVEVTLPTELDPFLTLRDYGTGMSPNFLRKVYKFVGKSDKRDSNDEAGMFGMGAKVVYGHLKAIKIEQALITSYYQGMKYNAVAYINKNFAPSLAIAEGVPTDEPNGCWFKVPIAVDEINSAQAYLEEIAKYTDAITLLNPVLKKTNPNVIAQVETEDYLFQYIQDENDAHNLLTKGNLEIRVLINGMPYKKPNSLSCYSLNFNAGGKGPYFQFIAKFKPGDVEPTASREAIRDESAYRIKELIDRAIAAMRALIQKDIDKCAKPVHAITLLKHKYKLGVFNYLYFRDGWFKAKSTASHEVYPVFPVAKGEPTGGAKPLYAPFQKRNIYVNLQDSELLRQIDKEEYLNWDPLFNRFWRLPYDADVSLELLSQSTVVLVDENTSLSAKITKALGLEGQSFFIIKRETLSHIPEYLSHALVYTPDMTPKAAKEIDLEKKINGLTRSVLVHDYYWHSLSKEEWAEILSKEYVCFIHKDDSVSVSLEQVVNSYLGYRVVSVSSTLKSYLVAYNREVREKFLSPYDLVKHHFEEDCDRYPWLRLLSYFQPNVGYIKRLNKDFKLGITELEAYKSYQAIRVETFYHDMMVGDVKHPEFFKGYLKEELVDQLSQGQLPELVGATCSHGRDKVDPQHIGNYLVCRHLGLDPIQSIWSALPDSTIFDVDARARIFGIY